MKKSRIALLLISAYCILAGAVTYFGAIHKGIQPSTLKGQFIGYGVVSIVTLVTFLLLSIRFNAMTKLVETDEICVLTPDYYKVVAESANTWVFLPYSTKDSAPSWYRSGMFTRVNGHLLAGFKIDWPKKDQVKSGIGLADALMNGPVETVFVPNALYERIQKLDNKGCTLYLSAFGIAKQRHENIGVTAVYVLLASSFGRGLLDKELSQLKSIDAFVGGPDE